MSVTKMEPQHSVFLYSKYSPSCKRLITFLESNGIDAGNLNLQFLCVDNDKVRTRIMNAENFDVTAVPCILIIFPDGGVEKYEGPHAFRWIEEIVSRLTPPPPPSRPPPQPIHQPPPPQQEEYQPPQDLKGEDYESRLQHPPREYQQEPEERPPPQRRAHPSQVSNESINPSRKKSKSRRPPMRPITEDEPGHSEVTSIDNIPLDDEQDEISDRHRSGKPIARLRKNKGNYENGDNMFGDHAIDNRMAPASAVRKIQATLAKDPSSLMARADALRKGREQINKEKPKGPQIQNRP